MLIEFVAAAGIFLLADFIYAMDHDFVHRHARRYMAQHRPHHDFYADGRATPLFMPGEFARYTVTGLATVLVGALLWGQTGVVGFLVGGALTTSMVMQAASEVLVYGTAVHVEPE